MMGDVPSSPHPVQPRWRGPPQRHTLAERSDLPANLPGCIFACAYYSRNDPDALQGVPREADDRRTASETQPRRFLPLWVDKWKKVTTTYRVCKDAS